MNELDLKDIKFEMEREGGGAETGNRKKKTLKIKIINYSKKTLENFKEIFQDKSKTPLPSVNLANADEIAVS